MRGSRIGCEQPADKQTLSNMVTCNDKLSTVCRSDASQSPTPWCGSCRHMLIGYVRVSTDEQRPDAQCDALRRAGVEEPNLYVDHTSGAKSSRPQWDIVQHVLRTTVHNHLTSTNRAMSSPCTAAPLRVSAPARVGVRAILVALVGVLVLSGCANTGGNRGGTFSFVSPGGKTKLFYDPPSERGTVGRISGGSVTAPNKEVSLSDYRGKVVVLNTWGSWCGPCRKEADDLKEVAQKTRSKGVQFIGINVDDDRSSAADFLRNNQVKYPSIYDPSGRSLLALGGVPVSTTPLTIVLDRQHRVAAIYLGAVLSEQFLPTVRRIAAEK